MKALSAAAILIAMTVHAYALTIYSTPKAASHRCRSPVVWLNTKTRIYHMPGTKNFGRTANGGYACEVAAEKDGYRAAANGQ
jgi:hypothetical protein